MRRYAHFGFIRSLPLAILAGSCAAPAAAQKAVDAEAAAFFESHCLACHSGEQPEGGLGLDRLQRAGVLEHARQWTKVLKMVRTGAMPPEGEPRPPQEKRLAVADWIQAELGRFDCEKLRDPGRVTIRRLNRAEYRNTIRDLLGVDVDPTEDFPADEIGYGFDNIGDVQSVSPLLMEKYLAAAEEIAKRAIVTPESLESYVQRVDGRELRGAGDVHGKARGFFTSSQAYAEKPFEKEGQYLIKITAFADQAGSELAQMAIYWDGKVIRRFEVEAEHGSARTYSTTVQASRGKHEFGVGFANDFYDPQNPDPAQRDRNLWVEAIEIVGPLEEAMRDVPASHRQVIPARPAVENRGELAEQYVRRLASRAFRRPARKEETDRLVELIELAHAAGGSFERGMQLVVQAVLVSPHFLFREEHQPQPDRPGAVYVVDEFALASRLSYFLWSSMPDDELFELARRAKLRRNLESQVRRMLADRKAQALVENFAGQWLEIRRLEEVAPDENRFPAFDKELRRAMRTETEMYFAHVMRKDRSVFDLLDARYTFLNERLARHYGIDGVQGGEFRRVELQDGRRGGVLTQASVLTITSLPTRTSPVRRGKWILEQILGDEPPPPPPNVPELAENEQAELSGSLRERLEQHRADPSCASCHRVMDMLGFALENYNAIGAWRDRAGKFPIDPSGELADGTPFANAVELKKRLAERQDQFRRNLAEKMLTYALGRGLEYYDRCALDRIVQAMAEGNDRFSSLILAVVRSDPFQMRRGDGGKP